MAIRSTKKPTLRTISELSGLAVTTVSRALNDAPDIGEATKARVREIARRIGYVPNRAGVRLRTGKTNVISLVLGTDTEVTDHTGQLVSSIAHALLATRYHMIVTPYSMAQDPMEPVRYIVETGSADAVIFNRIEVADPRVAYLMEWRFPFVTYGRSQWRDRHAYVDFDNAVFGRIAAERLVASGRRHLALLAPPLAQNYAQDMIAGLRDVADRTGVGLHVLEGIDGDASGAEIKAAVVAYLKANPETDGLVCPSTTAAIAAIVGAESLGRTIGADLGVAAKEALPFLNYFRPRIESVREDVRQAGTLLAQAAIQAIESPDAPPLQRLLAGDAAQSA